MCQSQSQSNINLADFPDTNEKDVEESLNLDPELGSFNLRAVAKVEPTSASLGGHSKANQASSAPLMLSTAFGFAIGLSIKCILTVSKRFCDTTHRNTSSVEHRPSPSHQPELNRSRYRLNFTPAQLTLLSQALGLEEVIEENALIPGQHFEKLLRKKRSKAVQFTELDPISTELVPVPVDEMKLPSQVVNRMALLEVRRENAAHVKNPQYPVKEIVSQILHNEKISANDLNLLKLAYVPSKQNDALSWVDEDDPASTQEHIGTISSTSTQEHIGTISSTSAQEHIGTIASTSAQSVTYDPLGDQASFFKEAAVGRRAVKAEFESQHRGKGKDICEGEPVKPFSMSQAFSDLPTTLQHKAAKAQLTRDSWSQGQSSASSQKQNIVDSAQKEPGESSGSNAPKQKAKGKNKQKKRHGRRN